MPKTLWILTRFRAGAAGSLVPGRTAERLVALAGEEGFEGAAIDPLDAFFLPADGKVRVLLETGEFSPPDLALACLDPFRPAQDIPFLEGLRDARVPCRNGFRAARNFREPLRPFLELGLAGVPAVRTACARRPHAAERLVAELGLPVEVRFPGPDGSAERAVFGDRGSLRGALDEFWREDVPVLAAPAAPEGTPDRWAVVIGDRCLTGEEKIAVAAARALDLDLSCVRLRGEGPLAAVVEIVPFPAPPGAEPEDAVLEEIADRLFET
jgi:hypothetical protein